MVNSKALMPKPLTQAHPQTSSSPSQPSPTAQEAASCSSAWNEDASFKVVGVGSPRKLQEDLSGLAAQMEPPLRPSFSVEEIEGEIVVAVEVPETSYDQKPCYHRPHRL